jgi:hypothetical protein
MNKVLLRLAMGFVLLAAISAVPLLAVGLSFVIV